MNWTFVTIASAMIVAFLVWKWLSLVSLDVAREHLAHGALVIDVRSPEEFQSGHVPGAINIPLGELRASLPGRVKDKNQVLLLHCLSGGRSGIARRQLRSLDYRYVFNLGSYTRAEQVVRSAPGG